MSKPKVLERTVVWTKSLSVLSSRGHVHQNLQLLIQEGQTDPIGPIKYTVDSGRKRNDPRIAAIIIIRYQLALMTKQRN